MKVVINAKGRRICHIMGKEQPLEDLKEEGLQGKR